MPSSSVDRQETGPARAALYAWGGPGTIALIRHKYHDPRIDAASFLQLYEPDYLRAARQTLGITDMWVTYSWGFSDETEQSHYRYIVERLPNFDAEGIAAYAYIQGLNLSTRDFRDVDVFCHDSRGHLLAYSRNRALTCPNNPAVRQIILDRVERASRADFAGVFIDNFLFGLPPFLVRQDYIPFFGCACAHCQRAFKAQFGYRLPLAEKRGMEQIGDYLRFRAHTMTGLLAELSQVAHANGKRFGINLYDPYVYAPELYIGYALDQIAPLLDYYLIENHSLGPRNTVNNTHLLPLLEGADKPVFIVSYRNGISYDGVYSQATINALWSEAAVLGYAPCLKATEYVTDGVWHALDIAQVQPPTIRRGPVFAHTAQPQIPRTSLALERPLIGVISRLYPRVAHAIFNNRLLARIVVESPIYARLVRQRRFVDCSAWLTPPQTGVQ
ncbi:MAG: hypothetical protein GYB65_11805 [Chloroflexi bacterium]|nr:hypothetical protein [Chloroflexota bacterium]